MGTPAVERIDRREYEAAVTLVAEYRLDLHSSAATALANIDPSQPTRGDLLAWRAIRDELARFALFHHDAPFVVAPSHTFSTDWLQLAQQFADDQHITIGDEALTRHTGIFGASGSGKTNLAHHLVRQAYEHGLDVVTIDGKADAEYFTTAFPRTLLITRDTPIPILEIPSWLTREEYTALLLRLLRDTLWGGEGLAQIAREAFAQLYEQSTQSLGELERITRTLTTRFDSYTRKDRIEGFLGRTVRLRELYPGFDAPAGSGLPLESLCTHPIYFGYSTHTEFEDLISAWLIELRFSHARKHQRRTLHTLVLLDESLLVLHEKTITEQATLARTFPLLREFGIGVLLTANNYRALPDIIRSSLFTQVALNLTDANESRAIAQTFGLNRSQQEYLDHHLTRGRAIIRFADGWKYPLLATCAPLEMQKTVTPKAWKAAEERTRERGRTTEITPALASPSRPDAANSPPSVQPMKGQSSGPHEQVIALNAHEEALLGFAARSGVALTTDAFRELALHPQAGTRAKKKLVSLSLLEEERIVVHRGRGGTAVAIRPTTRAGYERARVKRTPMRTGSLQHEWLVRSLARRIPKSTIELSIGGKSCDLVIAYNRAQHERFATFVDITPQEGDVVTIEAEVSQPAKTAAANVVRNASVGVNYTIIATMTPLRRTPPGAIIVDIFALLEAL